MSPRGKVAAIIPAAGLGRRLNSKIAKPFVLVFGKPLFVHTLSALRKSYPFYEFVLALDREQIPHGERYLKRFRLGKIQVVAGGKTRAESVKIALWRVSSRCDWVLVHDAARPLVTRAVVRRTLNAARRTGAAIAALPAYATVKRVRKGNLTVRRTEDRKAFYLAQTPQVFRRSLLLKRYRALGRAAFAKTDDAALFDGSKVRVGVARGETKNIKVTTPDDLKLLRFYLTKSSPRKRGSGQ